jgi:uncharacterized protein (DUF58 family)
VALQSEKSAAGRAAYRRFERELPAQLLKRIEFEVLRRLDGLLFGDYSGLFYGPSLDLAEVREYQPGDEVRRIDWPVTARMGTIHIRQYLEEREIIAWLVVDRSRSMAFGTRRVSKQELALEFAAVATAVLTKGGNKVGGIGFSERGYTLAPLRSGRRQPIALLQALMGPEPDGADGPAGNGRTAPSRRARAPRPGPAAVRHAPVPDFELEGALNRAGRLLRRRALVFVVSDFIDSRSGDGQVPAEGVRWERELRRLALRHDVIAVRISDPAELELPQVGDLRLRDPETGQELWIDTSDPRVRREHARLVARRGAAVERACRSAGADLLDLSTQQDLVRPLVRFTLARSGRRR